jgi:MoxR-like ATPase
MADEVPVLPLPSFSERDCALLSKYAADKPLFNNIDEDDKEPFRDLLNRLERLAKIVAARCNGAVAMTSAVSSLKANGRVSTSYWACILPKEEDASRTSESFSLQLAFIISPTGVEILLCLGLTRTQETNLKANSSNDQKLLAVRKGLAGLQDSTLQSVARKLSPEWHLRKLWRMTTPAQDFEHLAQWRDYAASADGERASISRYFDLDDLETRGDEISEYFLKASKIFQPIFDEMYAKVGEGADVKEKARTSGKKTRRAPSTKAATPQRALSSPVVEPPPRLDLLAIHQDFSEALRQSDLVFGASHDAFARTFLSSLATGRLVILTGLSGSGKTQIALRFSEWLGEGRGLVIPVRPDWTGAEALFGYEDALQPVKKGLRAWHVPQALEFMLQAAREPGSPHVLILDEMNLAHVERYFADFLSGMETRKPCLPNLVKGTDGCFRLAPGEATQIPLPSNLFVIGTVNADETTHPFSLKVLDRSNSIEFRVRTEDLRGAVSRPKPCQAGPSELVRGFLAIAADDYWHVANPAPGTEAVASGMERLHRILTEDDLEFGKRVFREALRFAAMLAAAGDADPDRALDCQLMQKILPRIHGSRSRTEPSLRALGHACFERPKDAPSADERRRFDPLDPAPGSPRMPLSFEKIRRMVRRARANQFTSFME